MQAFTVRHVKRIEIEVYTDNAATIALYQRFGFVIEGTCTQDAFRNGHYVDVYHGASTY